MTPAPVLPLAPTNALVAVAWIGQRVPGITSDMVATTLPRDLAAWAEFGFVQVTPIAGTPDIYVGVRKPVVQVDAWAVNYSASGGAVSTKPSVKKANYLAELVRVGTELPEARYSSPVTMPANYAPAIVLSAYPVSEVVEVQGDPSGYARVTFDLAIDWVRG